MKKAAVMILLIVLPVQALAYGKLQKGAEGAEVFTMQAALRSLGYSITVDGKYGPATVSTVKSFQRQHGLRADGIAGDKTLTLLYSLAPGSANFPTAAPSPVFPTQAPQYDGETTATVATTGGSLNLRQSPNSAARVVTTIPNGDQVIVLERGTGWAAVVYEGVSGYVMVRYLSFGGHTATAAPTAIPTAEPWAPAVQALVVTSGGSLNLRQAAGSGAKIIAQIPYGAWVTVSAKGEDWSFVSWNGQNGYVMSRYLSFGAAVPTAVPTALPTPLPTSVPTAQPYIPGAETAYVNTTGGSLNLREYARSGAKVLLTIPNGAAVTVFARDSVWCSVSFRGTAGYVMTSFLRFPADPASVYTPAPTPSPVPETPNVSVGSALITTSGGSVNLRAQASTGAKVLLSVPNASIVTLHARGPEWSAVTYKGTFGYIMSKYLTFLGSVSAENGDAEEEDPSVFRRVLKKGMTGEDVTWVQNRLDELGYSLAVTHLYDDATFSAVKSFQAQNGLDADGLAGAQTFAVLKSENARRADAKPLTYATLRIDQSGDGVRQLQTDLKALGYPVTVNGSYDTDTHNAVVAFQQRNGLVISGIADALTRQIVHSGRGKPYSTPVAALPAGEGWMAGPAVGQLKLLHWQNEIKPYVKAGQTFTVLDPNTSLSWKLVFYSLGRHADSQPASWRDTQIMNRSFGGTSWTIHPVYVLLPTGQWTLATMHNRPHLYGTITDNGFGGHLCVHFLRDMAEAQKNDPNYGVNNQVTLRNAWKALTGETVE